MHRRQFIASSTAFVAALALRPSLARQSTPASSDLPQLQITLTDNDILFPQPQMAGRYEITVANTGTLTESHTAIGRIPDRVTDAQYEEWLHALEASEGQNGETDAMTWDDIEFIGIPDWAPPGGAVTGIVDLYPGRYFLFDPFGQRGHQQLTVDGELAPAAEPQSDLTVTLTEMAIDLPEAAFSTAPVRWKIENVGGMTHEVAVIAVPADFTGEHLQMLFTLPEDATPPPGVPEFVYQPVAAIGLLGKGKTSWLDVRLDAGHYLAICMSPFGTGYPHGMDGMYVFFDVT